MSPTNTFSEDDPLALAMRPPAHETPEERSARLAEEAAAKKVSDEIDAVIAADNKRRKARAKKEIRLLLLGQSESGKSTCLKQFQILYAPQSFVAERDSWRTVILLNLVKSVRKVLDAISTEEESFSDDSGDIDNAVANNARRRQGQANDFQADRARAATPITFDAPTGPDDGRHSSDDTYAQYAAIKLRLSPLAVAEELLIRRLAGPDGEDEATNLGAWSPAGTGNTPATGTRIKEVFVRSSTNWKKGIFSSKKNETQSSKSSSSSGNSKHADDPIALVQACRDDMITLWKDPTVQATLRRKGIRMEESPGFYLNDIARITAKHYSPSNQDVLTARLKTIGVVEHLFTLESGGEKGYDWRIFDVGGHREQRHTWVPFFDDVHAIIFLAPISAFDQVLVEDKRVNRLEDSLMLFRQICANKLLGKVNMVLFLNKIDILESKLKAGVKLNRYIRSFGDRANTVENVSQYLLAKFVQVHRDSSPYPSRELYTHMTTVTDTNATAAIISDVREMILRRHLQQSNLM